MDSHPSPLEAVKSAWTAWEKQGAEGVLAHLAPDAEWVDHDGRVYHGREEIEDYVRELREKDVHVEPRPYTFEEYGECVIVAGGLRTRSRRGLSDVQRHWLYRVRDGQITRVESLSSREEALQAVDRVCDRAAA